jgi:glucose-6-phosphate 1-dehydrogenase
MEHFNIIMVSLKKALKMERPANLIIVIFGASGDLTARKLVPAIYSLRLQGMMPQGYAILGIGRTEIRDNEFKQLMHKAVMSYSEEKISNAADVEEFVKDIYYHRMNYDDVSLYEGLVTVLKDLDKKYSAGGNIIFYTATPPNLYGVIAVNLAKVGLAMQNNCFRRFIIEKPFGYDLESAINLNNKLHEYIDESQIYRIDHYLGKETVQNLLVTRFANGIFEPLWNRNYVERVEVTSAESIGVEERGGYYDQSGALRDMVQNHLLQMVGLTAMEPPSSLDADAIRNEVMKVFQSIQPINEKDVSKQVIRGQYTASVIHGKPVAGYREEKKVPPGSRTETFVAMKFYINNWRWGGVPFFIRTGKRLPTRVTEVVIHFRPTPHHLFRTDPCKHPDNQLIIRIQPDEGILLKFDMKQPGAGFNVRSVDMDFHYSDLRNARLPSAYERLLSDVMIGDSTLFSRDDEVETAWKFLKPIQEAWKNDPKIKIYGYPAGTWGPENSNSLFGMEGITWRYPCRNLSEAGDYCEL